MDQSFHFDPPDARGWDRWHMGHGGGLSQEAYECFAAIGSGDFYLRVAPNKKSAELMVRPHPCSPSSRGCKAVSMDAVNELVKKGFITKMTERMENSRTGWKDSGFTGAPGSEFYLCTQ